MNKKIAIHHHKDSFSENWIKFCKEHHIKYTLVNCYSTNIIKELQGTDILMWHWHHNDYKAQLFAKQLIISVENMNIKVFPNTNTGWHFDDKVGQKYLLESIDAPLIESYVFYDLKTSLNWIEENEFPKVFKLRGGAGASNVKLVKNKKEAIKLANTAFTSGFRTDRLRPIKEKIWQFKKDKGIKSFFNILKGLIRVIVPNKNIRNLQVEKNYLYFQEFIPNNDSDIRVIVINNKAFAIKRMVRKGDFRASGSGDIVYNPSEIPTECLKIAFETSKKLNLQSAAYDFVFLNGKALIIEVSYAFAQAGYLDCPGYWDNELIWYEKKFVPEYFIIESLLN